MISLLKHLRAKPTLEHRLHCLAASLVPEIDPLAPADEWMDQIEHAVDALRVQHETTVNAHATFMAMLQTTMQALADQFRHLSNNHAQSQRELQLMQTDLHTPVAARNVPAWREMLGEHLKVLITSHENQILALRRATELIDAASPRSSPAEETFTVDPATGFPCRLDAERAIVRAGQDESAIAAIVLVLNNMETITANLGTHFGDLLLQRFATILHEHLGDGAQLYRWDGPVIVALIKRERVLKSRSRIQDALAGPPCVRTPDGDVQVPIYARWAVLPLESSAHLLIHKIANFAMAEDPALTVQESLEAVA